MAERVLALEKDLKSISWCSAEPDNRGKRRCQHVAHQYKNESVDKFLSRIQAKISQSEETEEKTDEETLNINTKNLVKEFGLTNNMNQDSPIKNNPNWESVISSLDNPFVIGSKDDGTYEEAVLSGVTETETEDGISIKLTARYNFRGREFECDFGEVPKIHEDGSITIDDVKWRVLPVLSQNKSGIISYENNIVCRNKDGRNIAFIMSKDPDDDTVKIYGKSIPIDAVENYLQNGDTSGLNSAQIYALNSIDPIAFERFPDLKTNLRQLKGLSADEPNDISWRKCLTYEDIVKDEMRLQARRMGVTFRTNLQKRTNLVSDNGEIDDSTKQKALDERLDEKYPLFYQVNLSDNIKKNLLSRSNTQYVDDLNPLTALSQSQKISLTGPGGFNKDKAGIKLRMPHRSHEGMIDSLDVSSGKNCGLTMTLSNSRIDERGFIVKKEDNNSLNVSDFIPYKYHDDPSRAMMAVGHLKQACPIVGGEDPLPLDDASDNAWNKIKGSKMGCTLNTVYIPYKENTFEDAVVISESAAEKMTTIQSNTYRVKGDTEIKDYRVGQSVSRKSNIGGTSIKYNGKIKSIQKIEGEDAYSVEVESEFKMGVGDKLAGRHGNKSVVSKVLPDNEMPIIKNEVTGKFERADLIMSPLSVNGRKNLGQILECNYSSGKGKNINATSQVSVDGTIVNATCGNQYIMRLNHIAEKKLQSYTDELSSSGTRESARLGEMESILLSTSPDRLKVLDYLRHQESNDSHQRLNMLLKSIGVELNGVNWDN